MVYFYSIGYRTYKLSQFGRLFYSKQSKKIKKLMMKEKQIVYNQCNVDLQKNMRMHQ